MDPLAFLWGALGVAFGAGSAWAALNGRLKNLTQTVMRHDKDLSDHNTRIYEQFTKIAEQKEAILKLKAEEIGEVKLELVRITYTAKAMQQDLDQRAGASEKFEKDIKSATRWQNDTLMGIAGRVGVTRKDSSQYMAAVVDPRVESDSDAPKPMRPRLPTLRGKDE